MFVVIRRMYVSHVHFMCCSGFYRNRGFEAEIIQRRSSAFFCSCHTLDDDDDTAGNIAYSVVVVIVIVDVSFSSFIVFIVCSFST